MNQLELTTAPVLDLTPHDLDGILDELRTYHAIFSPLLIRPEQRAWAETYLHGLLLDIPRKSIEPMILHLRGADRNAVRAMQQFVGDRAWDDTAILRRLWPEVASDLGDDDGVLILDGSDFPKQGLHSVGVSASTAANWASAPTARRECFWPMPVPTATRCWIGAYTCPRTGLLMPMRTAAPHVACRTR